MRLLPIIIITALYALSGLLKKKKHQKEQQKRPQPKPKSTRREETLPTYARRRPQQPGGTTATQPKPAPRSPLPVPGKKPTPARPQPRPVPTRRPAEPKPEPIEIIPEPVARRPKPIPVPPAQRKHPPRTSHQAAQQAHARDQAKAKLQMPKIVPPTEVKKTTHRDDVHAKTSTKDAAAGKLNLALGKKSALVRAIVYAEILGKPIGLKSKGGYELE